MAAFPLLRLPLQLRREVYGSLRMLLVLPRYTNTRDFFSLVGKPRMSLLRIHEDGAKALATLIAWAPSRKIPSGYPRRQALSQRNASSYNNNVRQGDYSAYSIRISEELSTCVERIKRLDLPSLTIDLAKGARYAFPSLLLGHASKRGAHTR